jgi:hypothetical protein
MTISELDVCAQNSTRCVRGDVAHGRGAGIDRHATYIVATFLAAPPHSPLNSRSGIPEALPSRQYETSVSPNVSRERVPLREPRPLMSTRIREMLCPYPDELIVASKGGHVRSGRTNSLPSPDEPRRPGHRRGSS